MSPRFIWKDPLIDFRVTSRFGLSRTARFNSGSPYVEYHILFFIFRNWGRE